MRSSPPVAVGPGWLKRWWLDRILAAGRHLLALINELTDIAGIEPGEFSLSVEPVAVQPVVQETCQLIAPLAAAADRSIAISQDCPCADLVVNADRLRLRHILVNLRSDAIKYNGVGGTGTFTASRPTPARAKPATAGIPVAILSAEASPAIIRQMRASGALAYLTKPLDLTELGQLLNSFAAGHNHEASLALGTGPTP